MWSFCGKIRIYYEPREKQATGKQNGNFAGAAKQKVRTDKVAQRSLVQVPDKEEISDSYGEATTKYGNVAIVTQTIKHVSPRAMNATAGQDDAPRN